MSAARLIKYVHLAYFAKPVAERAIYRTIHKTRAGNLVAIGMGDGQLARNMIGLAGQRTVRDRVRFTGIDLFEMRTATAPGLSLKQAHRLLQGFGALTKLVPGDPFAALARTANALLDTDLIVIRADQLGASMDQAWFYVPRMMHAQSLVLVENAGRDGQGDSFEVLDRAAVKQLASTHVPLRRAA